MKIPAMSWTEVQRLYVVGCAVLSEPLQDACSPAREDKRVMIPRAIDVEGER